MSLEDAYRIASTFVRCGVNKIRITGGEPLVRKNILWLLEQLGALPGLDNLVLTTNGSQLTKFATPLRQAGVTKINVSLDSLNAERFHEITRGGDLHNVLEGISRVKEAGFSRIRINTVMLRGINDGEFIDLVRYAVTNEVDIAFIEEMPLGDISGRSRTFISSQEARARISSDFELIPSLENTGGPARYWAVSGSQTRVGFISPHTENFCASCNRVRVTANGMLHPCLGDNGGVDLKSALREENIDEVLTQRIMEALAAKPHGHDFANQMGKAHILRFMSVTGG